MKIKACIENGLVKHLTAVDGDQEVLAFIVGRTTYAVEYAFDLPAATDTVNILARGGGAGLVNAPLLYVDVNVHPGFYVYYCEHPELIQLKAGPEGVKEAVANGNDFAKSLAKSIDDWQLANNIAEYTFLNMDGYLSTQAAVVVIAKMDGMAVH